jgi:hypothetical protein
VPPGRPCVGCSQEECSRSAGAGETGGCLGLPLDGQSRESRLCEAKPTQQTHF